MKPGIEEDQNNQNACQSINNISHESQNSSEDKDKGEKEGPVDINDLVNELEETMQSIQNIDIVTNEPENNVEVNKNVESEEKIEVIDVTTENKEEEEGEEEPIDESNKLINETKIEINNSKGSLTQINTQNLEPPPQHYSCIEGDSKSFLEILDENGNKRVSINDDINDDKLKSAPAILEDDKTDRLISPESAMSIKSINPVHVSFFILP